jgi:hypothetical protein
MNLSKPKFTLTIEDTKLGKYMTIGVDSLDELRKKGISGKSHIYEFVERFKNEISSNTTK